MLDQIRRIKRQQILEAAMRVFSERGFHHATVSEVARTAHVGKGTVYLYFDGKEDLLVSLFDELVDKLIWVLDRVMVNGASLQEAVRRLVAEQLDHGMMEAYVFRLMAQQPFLADLALQREKRTLVQRVVERGAARIRDAASQDVVRPCNATLCACVLLALPGAMPLYRAVSSDTTLPRAISHVADELSEILWNGLKKEGS